jgi:hypothetical protein
MHHSSDLKARNLVLRSIRVLCHVNLEVTDIFSIHKMKEMRYMKSNSLGTAVTVETERAKWPNPRCL